MLLKANPVKYFSQFDNEIRFEQLQFIEILFNISIKERLFEILFIFITNQYNMIYVGHSLSVDLAVGDACRLYMIPLLL